MKRLVLPILIALFAAGLLAAFLVERKEHRATRLLYDSTSASRDSLRTSYEAALEAIVEIQDSLIAILPSEAQVMRLSRTVEARSSLTEAGRRQILERISDLNEGIRIGKRMIRDLEDRLKESEGRVAGLEKLVENLKRSIEQREEVIAFLTARVDSLRMRVGELESDVAEGERRIAEQERVIDERNRELATIHYVIDNKKNLKRLGIVQETGGILGLGKSVRLSGTQDPRHFKPFDTDRNRTLFITGRNPVVLSGQNRASYKLVPADGERTGLHILNPLEFRKVRYLVIQTD
ncbi:MAG: hypothetical protein FJY73_10270 [Candidatus Eisenbacteria bacterium]|nr:hypothetical protein [Candidatus Eisenbacteria bacterium]